MLLSLRPRGAMPTEPSFVRVVASATSSWATWILRMPTATARLMISLFGRVVLYLRAFPVLWWGVGFRLAVLLLLMRPFSRAITA